MRVVLDQERCEGHGLCEHAAPDVFSLDDEGLLQHRYERTEIPAEFESAAEAAAISCPVAALRIEK
jgi:ferredoxin